MSLIEEPGEPPERGSENIFTDAAMEFTALFRWLLSGLIQAFFLGLWVVIQWGVDEYIILRFQVTGINRTVLIIAQYAFAITTLTPILFFLLKQNITMYYRTLGEIRDIRNEFSKVNRQ